MPTAEYRQKAANAAFPSPEDARRSGGVPLPQRTTTWGGGGWKRRPTQGIGGLGLLRSAINTPNAPSASPPAAVEAPIAPAMPSYADEYQRALDSSRAGISKQFEMALSDIAQRENAAGAPLAALPGQLGTIYQQGAASNNQAAAALNAAQAATGAPSFMPAEAQMAPLAAASANDLASRQASVPLLALAVQQEFAKQRGGLQQARLAAENDLAAEQRGYLRDMAGTADTRAYQDAVRKQEQEFQLGRDMLASGGKSEPRDKTTGLTQSETQKIRESKEYKDTLASLNNKQTSSGGFLGFGKKKKGKRAPTMEELYTSLESRPDLLKVVANDIPRLAAVVNSKLAGG